MVHLSSRVFTSSPSPESWQESPQSPSTESTHDSPPKLHSVNSIVLSAPIATLRNLAHLPEPDQGAAATPMSPSESPRGSGNVFTPGVPPLSVISSFDPIKRGILGMDEAQRLFDM